MAYFKRRKKAYELRKKGWSIKDIASHIGVGKSTVSYWCRDIILSPRQKTFLDQKMKKASYRGRMKGAERNREKRILTIEKYQKEGEKTIKKLREKEFLCAGLGIYWGEGSKTSQCGISNSDPNLILFMYSWLQYILGVSSEDFQPRIFINAIHREREQEILHFWSNLLNLPESQFGKITFLKQRPQKVYENHNSYYGVLSLRVRRGAEHRYKILGLLHALEKNLPT